jgi:adenylate cyclase
MKSTSLKHLGAFLPIIPVVLGLALLLLDPLSLQALRHNLFDQYQRWHPREYTEVPVRIIDIDEESLARVGQWPWPRTRLAELVDKLNAAGVAAIGFDVVLAEADRTSPRAMAALWSLQGALRNAIENLPDHDQVLAQSLSGAPVVLGFIVQRGKTQDSATGDHATTTPAAILPARPFRYISSGEQPGRWLHRFDSAISARPELAKAAQGNGALSFVPDGDGVVRRVPLVLQLAGEPVPTLVAETLRVAQGERNYVLRTQGSDIGLEEIRIGQFRISTTAEGEIWVHYSPEVASRYLPAWKVLAETIPGAMLDGQLVLIGSSAEGLMDLRFSPLGRIMPGVEAHAQALEQILSGYILRRPGWARAVESIAIIIGGFAIGFVAIRASALTAAGTTLILLSVVLFGGWYGFREHALLLNTVTPALTFALAFVLGSLLHHFISEREQRRIRDVFSRYVSPNRVRYLVDHPEAMELGGCRQECSFIFTDLAGFTTLMETIDPGEAVSLLNAYLDQMIGIAFRHEGTLDRIVGDAVAIMFSAPVLQADHRARALACALEMDAFASDYAAELNARGVAFGETRIGIHSGEVIVGNFGGTTIADYRALGDPVNTAARLESVNKQIGTRICVSEATLGGCPEALARPIGRLLLKGKSQALQVFEPLDGARLRKYAPLEEYRAAYRLMANETPTAAATFRDLATQYPDDPLAALHHRRLAEGSRGDLIVLTEK